MKKIIFLLSILAIIFSLSGCGNDKEKEEKQKQDLFKRSSKYKEAVKNAEKVDVLQ